jgi:hypothetical protein
MGQAATVAPAVSPPPGEPARPPRAALESRARTATASSHCAGQRLARGDPRPRASLRRLRGGDRGSRPLGCAGEPLSPAVAATRAGQGPSVRAPPQERRRAGRGRGPGPLRAQAEPSAGCASCGGPRARSPTSPPSWPTTPRTTRRSPAWTSGRMRGSCAGLPGRGQRGTRGPPGAAPRPRSRCKAARRGRDGPLGRVPAAVHSHDAGGARLDDGLLRAAR